ncbi:FAD-dependent monooxygenase [Labrys monachus]|uniref:2-polyprenyl-6-methoxyphenol hydroxylase-like FAD-dependent oxidoreductase n=1 Tax=Labrys monachus TaxID=217067 RepID=A0ABU0FGU3_9HYPH|nr:FAD-dependent monooxygenase [Labrys monachus]MDQ0393833.1 2-polyprenyl-6-methoxyphenol hydroxylase-like FAD-dependent oxidoreductase [Labrys monachus]
MADILIVGAGPVGLTMAAELARYGVPVRIVDRAAQATQTSKALVVWSRTLELMDRMGCTPAFLDAGLRAHAAAMRSGTTLLGRARFDDIRSPYNFALMLPQRDTERLLSLHLRSLGVEVERQVELAAFAEGPDGVEARLRHPDGREERVHAPWLIGCDGAHSAVRHGLGFEFRGSAQEDDWLLADIRFEGRDRPAPDEVSIFLHRDGPLVAFPMPGGRARVVATVGKADPGGARPDPSLSDVQALVDRRCGGDMRVADPAWLSRFRINERKVARYGRGRVFLAGDAAHVHSPAGGQGMNTGMQDAFNLAWKLAMVVRGQGAAALLDSYSPERSAVGDMVLRNATRLTDIATLSAPAAQAARNVALRLLLSLHTVQDRLANMMGEVEIGYAGSPLSVGHGAGARVVPEHYGGSAPGSGGTPRFLLFTDDVRRGTAVAARYPQLLDAPRKAVGPDRLLAVRPDGYIGLSAPPGDWDALEAYLRRLA